MMKRVSGKWWIIIVFNELSAKEYFSISRGNGFYITFFH